MPTGCGTRAPVQRRGGFELLHYVRVVWDPVLVRANAANADVRMARFAGGC